MSAIDPGMPHDLYITLELHRRVAGTPDYRSEKLALQDIATQMLDHPEQVLPKLVERVMQMTGAASAGISAYEPQEGSAGIFRWRDLHGELARFEGAITPRDHSPCGVCLDRFEPTLTKYPERHYGWIADVGAVCPEVLLVPLYMARGQPLGTLWIVAPHEGYFNSGHSRIMRELATFVGITLAVLQDQQRLQEAVDQQALLAAEMNHRVKNLFSIVDGIIHVSKRSATSVDDLATTLSSRLHALAAAHALVRSSFSQGADQAPPTADLKTLLLVILKPYELVDIKRFNVEGPAIEIGTQAATSVALVFHEFATNAAKYGALASDHGHVSISWKAEGDSLVAEWRESGGPSIETKPGEHGFGSTLARNTITRQLCGTFSLNWGESGLTATFHLPLAELAR